MPKSPTFLLLWNSQQQCYELLVQNHLERYIKREDEEWWMHWLEEHTSFSFQAQHGRIALRKEARSRGAGYWYAYHTLGQRTRKHYLGRTSQLTIPHLEEIVAILMQPFPATKVRNVPPSTGLQRAVSTIPQPTREELASVTTATAQTPLLVPKMQFPHLPSALVSRERLLIRLDRGLQSSLMLISAPAGYGKTTLVRQWINERQTSTVEPFPALAWVSLDSADNDPLRFWRYVIAACQRAQIGHTTLAKLLVETPPLVKPAFLEMLVTGLLNELAYLPYQNILVLEDYHVLTSSLLHASVTFFLEHLPPALHVILLSRTEPPLPLARLRANGNLSSLSAADLRFSPQESRDFLQQIAPLYLSETVLQRIDTRLQGWPTGLRLLSLSLQGRTTQEDLAQALTRLEGGQRPLLDYFISEVLAVQPEPLQDFLLQTCMLDRLNDSLCNAVTGREDSGLLLDAIERANLFLECLDGPERWYRYHTLFAEAMQRVVVLRFGETYLRQKAEQVSHWYEQHDQLPSAIEAAIASADKARVANLIERFMQKQRAMQPAQYMQNIQEFHTLYRWVNYLPTETIRARPLLCFAQATALFLVGIMEQRPFSTRDISNMQKALLWAEQGFYAQGDTYGQALALVLWATVTRQFGDITEAADVARRALALLSVQDVTWKSSCLSILATEELLMGQVEKAIRTTLVAREYCEDLGFPAFLRANTVLLGRAYFDHGELHLAASLYRQMLASARQEQDYDDIADAQLGLAWICYEWNDLTVAQQQATEVLEIGKRFANEEFQIEAELVLASIEQAQGKSEAAQERCMTLLAQSPTTSPGLSLRARLRREIQVMLVRFQLAAGDIAAVERWLHSRDHSENVGLLQSEREALLTARLLLAQQISTEAQQISERVAEEAQKAGRTRIALEAHLLVSQAHISAQQMQSARQTLQLVIAQAASEGYLRLFLDEGESVAGLLQALLPSARREAQRAYLRRILRAFAQQRGEASMTLTESLSAQEQRVLHLLATGHTNPQIAVELIVSVNTVKTQVQSIYRKLNVKNRVEACEIARSLHLL